MVIYEPTTAVFFVQKKKLNTISFMIFHFPSVFNKYQSYCAIALVWTLKNNVIYPYYSHLLVDDVSSLFLGLLKTVIFERIRYL